MYIFLLLGDSNLFVLHLRYATVIKSDRESDLLSNTVKINRPMIKQDQTLFSQTFVEQF